MATLFDSASLALIPSGVKDGKAYSIKPTDGSGDFTFSRGTGTATRVNASGLIEKERGNLILQSNTFSNASWTKGSGGTGVSLTSGQSGYDGSSDAWLLAKNATGEALAQSISYSNVSSYSVYVKAGTLNWVALGVGGGTFSNAYFDLSGSGALGSTTNAVTSKIESIGSGWFRCTIVTNKSANAAYIYPADADGDVSGTSGNIVIQDAMLNQGLVAQPYIETTTAAVYEGITDNLPRLDYSGGASCPSLLLEPSRTNEIAHSEYIDSYYTFNDASATDNAIISPEGVQNAIKLVEGSTDNPHNFQRTLSLTDGDYAFSVYAKAGERDFLIMNAYGDASFRTWFNLSTGQVGTSATGNNPVMEDVGNGWYRCSVSRSLSGTKIFQIAVSSTDNFNNYQGDGTSGIYLYGAQVEAGSYPTSYIPTYGTSASRAGESYANNSATDLIGQTEGVLFIDFTPNTDIVSTKWLSFLGSGSNYVGIYVVNGTNKIRLEVAATTNQATFDSTSAIVKGQRYKCAIAYKQNDFVAYVNGVQLGTDSSGNVPTTSTIRSYYNLSSIEGTETHQLLLFKTRLTNAELASLTTI